MLKDELTVLFNTCDSYSDCWYPFFKLWYDFFPDHSLRIVLNTESKDFSFDGLNIECFHLYKPGERPKFGEQMNAHIAKINTPFVLTMLDDFFLNTPVDIARIEQCIEWLKNDEKAAQFYFTNIVDNMNTVSEQYHGFSKKDKISPYKINTMGAVWKKEKLLAYSIAQATPWEWEYYGTIRSFDSDDDFYACSKDTLPIMNYKILSPDAEKLHFPQLWGVVRGKWVVESVDALFKAHDIVVDYSQRGIFHADLLKTGLGAKLSAPLSVLVGEKTASDIKKYEKNKQIKNALRLKYYTDYTQYRRAKAGLPAAKG